MGGVAGNRYGSSRRSEPPQLALLHRISAQLIRAANYSLMEAIDSALAHLGEALSADRALLVTRDSSGFVEHKVWERRGPNGRAGRAADDNPEWLVDQLDLERPLVCGNRKELPPALHGAKPHISAAIFVPLKVERRAEGLLAVTARTPRAWTADAVRTAEWLADMVAAGVDRMATHSSLGREQEKRMHAEAETRRLREQLAHAGRVTMLGELAASLAHELNQPLTAIYTNAQAAYRFLDRKPAALGEARDALHDLGQDCRRAGDVLDRLRQMFRRRETERVPLSVGPLIEHVLKLLHEDAVARNVNVALDVRTGLPMVKGDRVQLEQVVMNLLVNAFDAVTGAAAPRDVVVRATARDGVVEVAVLDNGKGIARADLDRVFEPFFSRKPNGMGMGLAICRTIAEAHGGRISARPRSERGSVFELSLPALPPGEAILGEEP